MTARFAKVNGVNIDERPGTTIRSGRNDDLAQVTTRRMGGLGTVAHDGKWLNPFGLVGDQLTSGSSRKGKPRDA
jgi:hypothetical protein